MNTAWACHKLYQWGRVVRWRGLDYPSMATTEKARIGRGGIGGDKALPDDLEAVDQVVAHAPNHHKLIIVEIYTKSGSVREHAARLNIPRMTLYRRRQLAERYVSLLLTGP